MCNLPHNLPMWNQPGTITVWNQPATQITVWNRPLTQFTMWNQPVTQFTLWNQAAICSLKPVTHLTACNQLVTNQQFETNRPHNCVKPASHTCTAVWNLLATSFTAFSKPLAHLKVWNQSVTINSAKPVSNTHSSEDPDTKSHVNRVQADTPPNKQCPLRQTQSKWLYQQNVTIHTAVTCAWSRWSAPVWQSCPHVWRVSCGTWTRSWPGCRSLPWTKKTARARPPCSGCVAVATEEIWVKGIHRKLMHSTIVRSTVHDVQRNSVFKKLSQKFERHWVVVSSFPCKSGNRRLRCEGQVDPLVQRQRLKNCSIGYGVSSPYIKLACSTAILNPQRLPA